MYTHIYIGDGYLGFWNESAGYSHAKTSKHARKNTSTHAHTHARHTRHQYTLADMSIGIERRNQDGRARTILRSARGSRATKMIWRMTWGEEGQHGALDRGTHISKGEQATQTAEISQGLVAHTRARTWARARTHAHTHTHTPSHTRHQRTGRDEHQDWKKESRWTGENEFTQRAP